MSLASRTARNTALVVGARLSSKILVFAAVVLATRAMGQGDYGRFSSMVVYAGLVSIVADLGFRPLFTREVATDRSRFSPYLNSILSVKLVLSLPALAALTVAIRLALPSLTAYILPTFALLIATSFSNQLRATFYAMDALRYEGIAIMAESVILLTGVVLAVWQHWPWEAYLWIYAVSYGFTAVYSALLAFARFGHRFAFDLDWRRLRDLGRQSLPFALAFIIVTLYYRIDVAILKVFAPFAAVGVYSAAYKYLDAVSFVPQTLLEPLYPSLALLARDSPDRLRSAVEKAYKMLAVTAMPIAAIMIIFAGPIVETLIPAFGPAAPVLRVLGIGVVFLFVNNVFIYTLNAIGRQGQSTWLAVVSLVVNVALNLLLIPQQNAWYGGMMGAAWATAITEMALFLGGYALLRRYLFRLSVIGALRGAVPSGVACAAVMAAGLALLPHRLWAYGLTLVCAMIIYGLALYASRAFTPEEISLARGALRSRTTP